MGEHPKGKSILKTMDILIGKTGNGTATIGCLRPGCGNKVVINSDVQEALTCNDLKCKTYMSIISSEFLDVKSVAHDYFREIGKYEILGGRKNKDAKHELLSKRNELKMQIWQSYKQTVFNNEVKRKKRAREIRDEVERMESQFKKLRIDEEDADDNEDDAGENADDHVGGNVDDEAGENDAEREGVNAVDEAREYANGDVEATKLVEEAACKAAEGDEEEELIEFSDDEEYGQHAETWDADQRYENTLEGMDMDEV